MAQEQVEGMRAVMSEEHPGDQKGGLLDHMDEVMPFKILERSSRENARSVSYRPGR